MRKQISIFLQKYLENKNSKVVKKIYLKNKDFYINKSLKFDLSIISTKLWYKVFRSKSIVIQPNFLDKNSIININNKIKILTDYSFDFMNSNDRIIEKDNVVYQKGSTIYNNHKKIYDLGKCLVLVRDDFDKGMIDIFNFELLFEKNELDFIRFKIQELSTNLSLNISWGGFNAYVNNSIIQTRGFHADSYSFRVKAFVYLTDVLKPEDGPYTFVYRSPLSDFLKLINRGLGYLLYKGTESLFFNKKAVVPIYGKAGTLIISDQSESHRGLPQGIGGSRAILVINSGV